MARSYRAKPHERWFGETPSFFDGDHPAWEADGDLTVDEKFGLCTDLVVTTADFWYRNVFLVEQQPKYTMLVAGCEPLGRALAMAGDVRIKYTRCQLCVDPYFFYCVGRPIACAQYPPRCSFVTRRLICDGSPYNVTLRTKAFDRSIHQASKTRPCSWTGRHANLNIPQVGA